MNFPALRRVLVGALAIALSVLPAAAQECTRVNDKGAEVRLPDGSAALHLQYRSASGTWRNLRNVSDGELYLGDLSKDQGIELRTRPEGEADWTHTWTCAAAPERTQAAGWKAFMAAVNHQPFEVYGLGDAGPAVTREVTGWGGSVRARGDHLVVTDHGGAMALLPKIVFAAGRHGVVPRFGIDGHGDPGPLSTDQKNEYRAFWDLVARWSTLPDRPNGPPPPGAPGGGTDPMPLVPDLVNPAPDGGGYPEDGTPLGPNDKMCKYLVCEPFSCGQPPLPPYEELKDCSGLQDQLDDLADQIDYWNARGQFWLDTVRYLDLAMQGSSTAEMGVQLANMASALGMILAPEPVSTFAGVVLAATTFADFLSGQLMDAIGVCGGSAACSMAASKAAAEAQMKAILDLVVELRLEARAVREALFECLGERARQQQALAGEIAAFEQAMAAYEACRDSQVCEWRSRPCR